MKTKLIFFIFTSLAFSVCYADRVNNELTEIVKNLLISDGVEIIAYQADKYIVSVADADINGNTPIDRLNAMKVAKQISESDISKFINGEDISIKEKFRTIRVVKSSANKSKYIKDEDLYEEFIVNKSSGVIRNMKNIRWISDNGYYVATLLKL